MTITRLSAYLHKCRVLMTSARDMGRSSVATKGVQGFCCLTLDSAPCQ